MAKTDNKVFIQAYIEQRPEDFGEDVLRVYSEKLTSESAVILEKQIQLVLKKAPRFIPKRLWAKLATYFIYIKEYPGGNKFSKPTPNTQRESK